MRITPLVWLGCVGAILMSVISAQSRAELLERIEVKRFGNNAQVQVHFTLPVQYLRHFPQASGSTLRIYVALVPTDGVVPLVVQEFRKSPPNELLPPFTVVYPDQGGSVLLSFERAVEFKVGPGSDARSIRIVVPLPKPLPERTKPVPETQKPGPGIPIGATPAPAPAAPALPPPLVVVPAMPSPAAPETAVNTQAGTLMSQARIALDAGNRTAAIESLNRLLNLPPNRFSQEAQELAGVARELNGETAKARAEYELYLKLYPHGEGAQRVRDRLALLQAPTAVRAELPPAEQQRGLQRFFYGSLSQYYYRGATKIDTISKPPQLLSSQTLSLVDQSALITALDITGRVRGEQSDSRIVLRDAYTADFLDEVPNQNRLYAAYIEHDQKNLGTMLRAGRQSPPTGGANERFDGGFARQRVNSWLRVFGLGGTPKEIKLDSTRRFYQAGIELGREGGAFGATLYGFNQTVDEIPDRRTAGGELRFFGRGVSLFSLVDYDVLFGTLNILLTQANWQGAHGTGLNLIVDRRKTPTIQTINALAGETTTSVKALLDGGLTAEELRERARAVTADSTLLLLGVTQTMNSRWQFGGDVRVNRISATAGSALLPPAPASGNIYTYTLQTTATALFGQHDVNVLSIGYVQADTYRGPLLLLSNSTSIGSRWRIQPSLRYYQQTDDFQTRLGRINPSLRMSYMVRNSMSLEFEAGYERTQTETSLVVDNARRRYFSLGYRWDFN